MAVASGDQSGETVRHEDVRVRAVQPGTHWKREDMAAAYDQLAERYGPPRAVVCDGAVERREGAESLKTKRGNTIVLQDLKHKAAIFLRSMLEYLALLERKPNALDFGKPFEAWDLPKGFGTLQRRLESESGSEGRREFIKILRLLESHPLGELSRAIDRALDIGALMVDVIRILLQEGRESPAKFFRLDGRPHLQDHHIPAPRLFKYSQLLTCENDYHEET